jgi:2-oxoglutarate dehydrogenase E2 component (dihydrolipoamide succinyltransferase)
MPTRVIMPELGESVEEATISQWLKAVGDEVKEFEPLLEVNTDKVDTEIPSPTAGIVLQILAQPDEVVDAGTTIAWIGAAGEAIPDGDEVAPPAAEVVREPQPVEVAPAPQMSAEPRATQKPGRDPQLGFISPVVARMASEHNLDLSQLTGTGKDGRITKDDVAAFLATGAPAATKPAATSVPAPTVPGELLKLSKMRKSIADHMVMSKQTSPHVTTVMEVDLAKVTAHRAANKAAFARDDARLTFTPYFVNACVTALKAYPIVNSSWTDEGVMLHKPINIGMATALEQDGLIVPVIKGADSFSLLGLARAVNDLAERARSKQLVPDEVRDGTFTITNHGTSGSLFATPIINQPQCAILGVGMIQKRAVVINDAIAIRPMVYLSLTFDHRILDGATADYFLGTVKKVLEEWSE